MEALIEEKIVQKENELNATYDEKMMNYEERCVYPPTPESLPSSRMAAIVENAIYNGNLH
jgi:hypothetical protein